MANNDRKNLNKDQSAKSISGKINDKRNTTALLTVHDGENKRLVAVQPKFHEERISPDGEITITIDVNMDQEFAVLYRNKPLAAIIHIDGTTTFGHERVKTKTTEGSTIMRLTNDIRKKLLKEHEDLSGHELVHNVVLLFPDQAADSLQNPLYRQKAMSKFAIAVNYKTQEEYVTNDYQYWLDACMRTQELLDAINEIESNPDDYIWNKTLLAQAWKKLHNEPQYKPIMLLTKANVMKDKDRILYWIDRCLKKGTRDYVMKDLDKFCKEVGLSWKGYLNKHDKLEMIKKFISENF